MKCKYYPCHFKGQDCSLCYCPLYPCKDTNFGKWYKGIWDCSDCDIVHDQAMVWMIKGYIKYLLDIKQRENKTNASTRNTRKTKKGNQW